MSAGRRLHAAWRPPRRYSEADKATFLKLLAESGNVSAVAKELGFTRVTCYQWAHKAGIFTSKQPERRRQDYLRLRAEGVGRPEAAATAGVHLRAAADWDKGIRQIVGGRVYADGRVTLYGTTMPRVTTGRQAYIHGDLVDLAALERPLDARFLSLPEREQIHDLQAKGASIRSIARTLGRAPSTVSRELTRNTSPRLGYLPYDAHRRAAARRPRPKQQKVLAVGPLRTYVLEGLTARWSPEQISRRLIRDYSQDLTMRACPETIYQAVYSGSQQALPRARPALRLRHGRMARKQQRLATRRTPRFVAPMV